MALFTFLLFLSALHIISATEDNVTTIDQQLETVLTRDGVKMSPVIELHNGQLLYDLDEVLTPEQFVEVFGNEKFTKQNRRITLRAAAIKTGRWQDNVFPYVLDRSYGSKDRKLVEDAMKELEDGTCVKFQQRRRERNYVEFINDRGCYSMLGMINRGRQALSLSRRGCRYRATVLHEILHALGVIHEQERPDRDNYVRIITRNMMRGMSSQFDRARASSINYYGVPYDFSSVMHYGLKSFSKNGRRTIEPINEKNAEKYIGRQLHSGLSFGDYKLVNFMYSCGSQCSIDCPEPGYVSKECQCVQPSEFYQRNCRGGETTGWCFKYVTEGGSTQTGGGSGGTGRGGGGRGRGGSGSGKGGGSGTCNEKDKSSSCTKWKSECAEGKKYHSWMMKQCRKTCLCGNNGGLNPEPQMCGECRGLKKRVECLGL